jgi:hypothetical protein
LNGAARNDVEAGRRSNLISDNPAKVRAARATKKEDFFLARAEAIRDSSNQAEAPRLTAILR